MICHKLTMQFDGGHLYTVRLFRKVLQPSKAVQKKRDFNNHTGVSVNKQTKQCKQNKNKTRLGAKSMQIMMPGYICTVKILKKHKYWCRFPKI